MDFIGEEKKMTVKEVAEALGVSDDSVLRSVKTNYPNSVKNGKPTLLNEEMVTVVKTDLQGHHNLRSTAELSGACTDLEMKQKTAEVMAWLLAESQRKDEKIAIMSPKAEFFDQVTSSKDAIEMKEVAKVLNIKGVGRNNLFQFLRDKKVLMENNTPFQSFIDRGYFRVIESKRITPDGDTKISLKTVVYQRGIDYIRRLIRGEIKGTPAVNQVDVGLPA